MSDITETKSDTSIKFTATTLKGTLWMRDRIGAIAVTYHFPDQGAITFRKAAKAAGLVIALASRA